MLDLNKFGHFTWNFGQEFFIETDSGNYVWKDPDYQGDNTIVSYVGSYMEWCKTNKIPFGRDKGHHKIKEYCGDVTLQESILGKTMIIKDYK